MTDDLLKHLDDPVWRIRNLYEIRDKSGKPVPFVPTPEQEHVIHKIYVEGRRRLLILKARQLGMSTLISIIILDAILWQGGIQASIVDQTAPDAKEKLREKVLLGFQRLPQVLLDRFRIIREKEGVFEIQSLGETTTSTVFAGMRARGGTNQILHVSEWGAIQHTDTRRSEEILTGALPSAESGLTIVETTWKGGKGGHLWRFVEHYLSTPVGQLGDDDFDVLFFPWWTDQAYQSRAPGPVGKEIGSYLDDKELELGITFTPGQRSWYQSARTRLREFIYREFPTTIDECWMAPVEGAIYASTLEEIRGRGQIVRNVHERGKLVHTAWDLGAPENMVTWYLQEVGREIYVIDCDNGLDLTTAERVALMLRKGYSFGWHLLPHDAAAIQKGGITFQAELEKAGLTNTKVVPVTRDIWRGINRLQELMPRMWFDVEKCERGLECLMAYRRKQDRVAGYLTDNPVHDWSSHASDALRTYAEAEIHGMITAMPGSARRREGLRRFTSPPKKVGG